MNYLVIDLEMCKVPKYCRSKEYRHSQEIIQVGAVLLDAEYEITDKISIFVKPEHGVVEHFISDLTGIKNIEVKNADKLGDVLMKLIDWIGDRQYQVIAWSGSDRSQLMHEIRSKKLENEQIAGFMEEERWIDYQNVFRKRFGHSQPKSLEETLILCDIEPDGRFHDGLDDAINTSKIFAKLEKDKAYKLPVDEYKEKVTDQPLSFSMGGLFEGLKLDS